MKTKLIGLTMVVGGALFAQSQYPTGGNPNYYPPQVGYNQAPAYDQGAYSSQYPSQYPPQYQQQYPVQAPYSPGAYMDVRPPMPGPGYIWIDGYENEFGQFMPGYWALPPYAGSFWVAPRLFSGRWVAGYWGGSRGFVGGEFREGFHDRDFHDRDFGDRGFRDGGFRPGGFREAPHAEFRGGNQSFRVNSAPSFQGGGHSGGSPRGGFSQGNSSQGGHGRR